MKILLLSILTVFALRAVQPRAVPPHAGMVPCHVWRCVMTNADGTRVLITSNCLLDATTYDPNAVNPINPGCKLGEFSDEIIWIPDSRRLYR